MTFQRQLTTSGQQDLDIECVLLMEGKLVRRLLGSVQQQVWDLGHKRCSMMPQALLGGARTDIRRPSLSRTLEDRTGKAIWRAGQHLRTFAACDVDRVLVIWIASDELAALHPFFLQKFDCRSMTTWMKRFG